MTNICVRCKTKTDNDSILTVSKVSKCSDESWLARIQLQVWCKECRLNHKTDKVAWKGTLGKPYFLIENDESYHD